MSDDLWIDEGDNRDGSLWPRVDFSYRTLHGVAFPDPEEPECHIVRYVGTSEQDARDFAKERGGVYVTAEQSTTVEREPWRAVP